MPEEKVTKTVKKEEDVVMMSKEVMDKMMSAVLPQSLQEKLDKQQKEHESKYIDHDDMVAVIDFSTRTLAESDAIPGQLVIVSGPKVDEQPELAALGISNQVEFTKQGQRKEHRFRVVINFIPSSKWT